MEEQEGCEEGEDKIAAVIVEEEGQEEGVTGMRYTVAAEEGEDIEAVE